MIRHAAVAGRFYPSAPEALQQLVERCIDPNASKTAAIGLLSPHAGLIYSGAPAGAAYSGIELPGTVVLIGPNHTGLGQALSLMSEGTWETPFGPVAIDTALARAILSKSPLIREDALAHLHEHSLEVQLPFIQYFKKDVRIVPVQMLDTRLGTCIELGKAVGNAIAECGMRNADSGQGARAGETGVRDVLVVASSDMSHYESAAVAREKDFKAIGRMLERDAEGLYRTVKQYGISMCGYGPAVAMLTACNLLGASRAELIKYSNSGDVSGDHEQVVGYASIVVR